MIEITEDPQVTEEVLNVSDIARELGITRQAIYKRRGEKASALPEPDYRTPLGMPLWKRSTLERAGVLKR